MQKYAIHWFRRDLRISGNPALQANFKQFEGRILGLFCFDPVFLSREDFSANRFQFFLQRIKNLKTELQACGGDLLVLDHGPEQAFKQLFQEFKKAQIDLPEVVSFCRDYEPFARARDQKMTDIFSNHGIEVRTFRDHLIIEPHELSKEEKNNSHYQVFTPFSRKWNHLLSQDSFMNRIRSQQNAIGFMEKLAKDQSSPLFNLKWSQLKTNFQDCLNNYLIENQKRVTIPIPDSTTQSIVSHLKDFSKKINDYSDARDIPSLQGTSQFSLFFKNGSLTTSQVLAYFELNPYDKANTSQDKFLSEIIWREFYYHILYHHPRVEHEAFNIKYRDIKWQNDRKLFDAWTEGLTGFPIIDAGMRQLKQTGWMHNRVRMIVASFLTKDLLIDWKWGEKYFMHQLLDGDLAPNNGGWQWAASTGCDPQPYFRIFNPWSQSEKFDPEGIYIKHFVPELSNVPSKQLHSPLNVMGYPKPIVEHATQRAKALSLYAR